MQTSMNQSGTSGNRLFAMASEIRKSIFEVLFLLLKEEETSVWQLSIMRMIDFFQLMVFPFSGDANFPWNAGNLFTSLQTIIEAFQVISYFSGFPWATYLVIFYLGILLVLLVIVDIIYVLYSMARKKFSFIWPLKALTSFCSVFVTIMFLPLLKLFVSMISCHRNSQGVFVHNYYTSEVCWEGYHILHAIMAIVVSIVFILISLIVTLTFYDTKTLTANAGSKVNSRTDVFLVVYKIICIVLFAFFSQEYAWILVAVLVIGSTRNYYKCKVDRPYFNEKIALLWNITNAIYLWVNGVLLVCMLLRYTSYSGGIQLIGLGIPLVVLMEFYTFHPGKKLLSRRFEACANGRDCELYLRYLTYVVYYRDDRDNRVQLDAYIANHIHYCRSEECPLTVLHRMSSKSSDLASKSRLSDTYKKALKAFPGCVNLRIRYAFFLLEYSESKERALKQLQKAERFQPALDDSFVIYRYGRILQEGMTDSNGHGGAVGLDAVTILAYNNYYRQCKAQLERAAHLHIEFWAKLNTHIPDVGRLIMIGTRISKTILDIENYWGQMQKINPNVPKAVKMYAEFLKNVLHDEEAAQNLMKSLANHQYQKTATEFGQGYDSDQGYLVQSYGRGGVPCLCASGDTRTLGTINNANSALCRIIGYSKGQLVGKHINMLIPELIAAHHNKFLQHAAEYKDDVRILGKELKLPCKLGNGYIMMGMLLLKSLPSFVNNMNFVVLFKIDKESETKDLCYLLVDPKGHLVDISEKCIDLLGITAPMVRDKKTLVTDLFADVSFEDIRQARGEGRLVTYKFPHSGLDYHELMKPQTPGDKSPSFLKPVSKTFVPKKFKCTATEIVSSTVGPMAYVLKLTPFMNLTRSLKTIRMAIPCINSPPVHVVFDPAKGRYIRQVPVRGVNFQQKFQDAPDQGLLEVPENDIPGEPLMRDEVPAAEDLESVADISELLESPEKYTLDQFLNSIQVKKPNYSDGIVTRQLFVTGKIIKVRRQPRLIQSIYEHEEGESKLERKASPIMTEHVAREAALERARIGKVKAKMRSSLGHFPVPKHITNLRWISFLLVASFICLTIIEYLTSESALIQVRDTLDITWMKGKLFSYIGETYHVATLLALVSQGLVTNYEFSITKEDFVKRLQAESKALGENMQQTILRFAGLSHKIAAPLQQFLWDKDVPMVGFNPSGGIASRDQYSLYEALIFISEAIAGVERTPADQLTMEDRDILFIRYNYLNSLLEKAENGRSLSVSQHLVYKGDSRLWLFIILLLGLAANLASAALIIPFMRKADYVKEESLTAFLCIPQSSINMLQTKCERFLAVYDTDKEPDDDRTVKGGGSQLEIPGTQSSAAEYSALINGNSGPEARESHTKRKFQKSSGEILFLILKVLFVMIALDSYFVFSYSFVKYVQSILEKRCVQIEYAGDLGEIGLSSFAIIKETLYGPKIPVRNQSTPDQVADQYLNLFKNGCQDILLVFLGLL